MKTRIVVSVIAVPILFVILFFLPPWCLAVFTAALCAAAALEFTRALYADMPAAMQWLTACAAALLPLSSIAGEGAGWAVKCLFLLGMFGYAIYSYEKQKPIPVRALLACMFSGLIYPMLIGALNGLKSMDNGHLLVLLPIVITFCCDSSAYFAGVFLGRHRVTPLVSPHKSAEGFAGGIVGGVVCLLIYGLIVSAATDLQVNYLLLIAYGLLGSLCCEIGDLAYSLIKRQCGVKDYGSLIPGHGGVLDRFDSMSFVAPAVYALVLLAPVMT